MENIKKLSKDDYDEVLNLSQFAFQSKLIAERLEEKKREMTRHDIFGYFMDGNLASKLHIIPLHVQINGVSFKMGGIASVATWPEYRRRGIAKSLLIHALHVMKENGQSISYLHPFHVGFYRKFGWEIAFSEKNYEIPIEKLKRNWGGKGYVGRSDTTIPLLQSIYEKYATQYNGMLIRDEHWWEQRVLNDEYQIAIAYNDKDKEEGYVIYKVLEDICTVVEIAYTSLNGRNVLFNFITDHDSMAEKVKITVPENDLLPHLLDDPEFEQTIQPYFMARIVDVDAFLKQYPFKDGAINIQISDEFLPENNGSYWIQTEKGENTVSKMSTFQEDGVKCNIQQLTAICLGYKRPHELFENGFIKGSMMGVEQLEKMIPHGQTFFPDFF